MADGAGGVEARLETLASAVMKQTEQVAEMRGTMKSFIDFELAAKQRLEIRVETEGMIDKSLSELVRLVASERVGIISETTSEVKEYTDVKMRELESRLHAQEERDKKRENDIRIQFIGVAVMASAGLAYAIYSILVRGAV
jgi:LPS O-antigen subunit length determinant protein (WzzB/FepE family)